MKNLTQYLKKTMFFFTPLLVVAFGLNYLADEGLKRTDYVNYKQWSRLYEEKADADILILGNSRAACHVDPELLGRSLSASVYNLGLVGGYPQLQYRAYEIYRKQNSRKPSLIVLNVDWTTVTSIGVYIKRRKADYLPWCTDPDWKDILEQAGYTLPERYLPLLKYGTRMQFLQLGLFSYWGLDAYGVQSEGPTYDRGYLSHERVDFSKKDIFSQLIDGDLSVTTDFFRQCRQEGIPVVGYYSPLYEDCKNDFEYYQKTYQIIDSLLSVWDIPFLDYSDLPICKDTSYFRDCVHLNSRGAEWLTKRLACDIDSLARKRELKIKITK